jgi:hypothetical protein
MGLLMPYPATNLEALINKLPEGSLARKLVAAFETGENIEAIRQRLKEILETGDWPYASISASL